MHKYDAVCSTVRLCFAIVAALILVGVSRSSYGSDLQLGSAAVREGSILLLLPDSVQEAERVLLRAQVQQGLHQQQEGLRLCYQHRLDTQPTLRGSVTLLFVLAASGQTDTPSIISSSLNDLPTESCLIQLSKSWTFLKPSIAKVPVIYHLDFVPVGAETQQMPEASTVGLHGSLDKEIIRRIIRSHLDQVRECYQKSLLLNAGLTGRVMVQFIIGQDGTVPVSLVQSTTIGNVDFEHCLVNAVRTWKFPKPQGGGIVVVSYPFMFRPNT